MIYNGSFFYNEKEQPRIIKFNLKNFSAEELVVPHLVTNNSNYLYSSEYNYLDFSVDDNGMWVIFPVQDSNNTAVMKVSACIIAC